MIYFSHGSNNLAGVLILIHRFKGDIVNYMYVSPLSCVSRVPASCFLIWFVSCPRLM